jgi:transglutaminase-like putative cysteine protease
MGSENRARLAFALLLLASLLAFSQLFDGGPYLGPPLLGAVLATLMAVVARRMGVSVAWFLVISTAALIWYLAAVFQVRSLFFALPTARAVAGLGALVSEGLRSASVDFAPVPPRPGYMILLTAAVWVASALGEVATFRWRRPLLASVAPMALFSLAMVVGTRQGTTFFLALFLGTLFTFWGVDSSHRLRSWGRWVSAFTTQEAPAESPTASVARRMGMSCVAAAVLAPLLLPSLDKGLVAWRTGASPEGIGTGAGPSASIDLLVSLAPTLTEQTSQELFVVEADAPAYWRLTSLADFDGRDWRPARPERVTMSQAGTVAAYQFGAAPPPTRLMNVFQRFEITGLGSDVLPAATHPSFVSLAGTGSDELVVDAGTGELRVADAVARGLRYSVQSRVPGATWTALENAALGDPGAVYTALPEGISAEVAELARRWTAGEDTPFRRLVAIQDRLRAFEYSLEVTPEDSSDYLTQFLTETQRGYCQQFATAFAVLARLLGYPARVSVGFLPGATSNRRPDRYVVTGTDAHAWPEVYFEDFGWVAFEPTPRSSAQQPSYTFPALNALAGGRGAAGGAPTSGDTGFRGRTANEARAGPRGLEQVSPTAVDRLRNPAWIRAFNRLLLGLTFIVALFALAVPVIKELRTLAVYRRADTPGRAARAAYSHFEREAADLATRRRPSESARAFATRLTSSRRATQDALALVSIYEAAEYSMRGVTSAQAAQARMLAAKLRRALWTSASWWQRCERLFGLRRV